MIEVPAALQRPPVAGEVGGSPELGAVVDGDRADEREEDRRDLNGEGCSGKVTGEDTEMFEGQQKKQVQEGGGGHPEGHDFPEQPGEGGADRDVDVERLAIQRGMSEGGHV